MVSPTGIPRVAPRRRRLLSSDFHRLFTPSVARMHLHCILSLSPFPDLEYLSTTFCCLPLFISTPTSRLLFPCLGLPLFASFSLASSLSFPSLSSHRPVPVTKTLYPTTHASRCRFLLLFALSRTPPSLLHANRSLAQIHPNRCGVEFGSGSSTSCSWVDRG